MTEQESPLNFNAVKIKKRDDTTTTRWSGSGASQWTALPRPTVPAAAPCPGRPAWRAAGTSARRCASAAGCAAGAGAASAGRTPPAACAAAAAGPGWSDPGACWTGPGPERWAALPPPTGWAAERPAAEASRSPSYLQWAKATRRVRPVGKKTFIDPTVGGWHNYSSKEENCTVQEEQQS